MIHTHTRSHRHTTCTCLLAQLHTHTLALVCLLKCTHQVHIRCHVSTGLLASHFVDGIAGNVDAGALR